jgi:diacylglycerol diphosphate phosphatase / phosphatidate phosphatase
MGSSCKLSGCDFCHQCSANKSISYSVLGVIYSLLDKIITPFHQHFSLKNYTIQYPYAIKERVPNALALFICVIIPMIIIAIYTLILDGIFSHRRKTTGVGWSSVYRLKDRLWELNCGILGLFLSEGAALVITGSLKNLCGKPRPDLISRCQPFEGAVDPPVFGLSNSTICTQTSESIMADGFRSFPSGHASAAFAGLFYLSLYLAAKLHVLDHRGEVWRTFIVLIPTLAASCVAMTRIMDARHHPFDILFGTAMGILVAWASYRQYFPPVSETWNKGRAYPIRTWGTETKRPPGGNEIIQKDADMEPYRTSTQANLPAGMNAADQQGQQSDNVFREQISRSQRQRTEHEVADNPFVTTEDGTRYMSPRGRDADWSATSSEDGVSRRGSPGDVEAFEMQRQPYMTRMADPDASAAPASAGQIRHEPPSVRVGGGGGMPADEAMDTEYRSQTAAFASPTHPGQRVLA